MLILYWTTTNLYIHAYAPVIVFIYKTDLYSRQSLGVNRVYNVNGVNGNSSGTKRNNKPWFDLECRKAIFASQGLRSAPLLSTLGRLSQNFEIPAYRPLADL